MPNIEVDIAESFEVLTKEEWDTYLETELFDKIKINPDKFVEYKDRLFLYPLVMQTIRAEQNKVGSMVITYALCKHYYDKGIPDEPWYKSPGDHGESVQYMPEFKEEHWMRRYWFNHFAESMYLKYFSVWDCITELLDVFYGLQTKKNSSFKYKVLNWLKNNKKDVANFLEKDVFENPIYVEASMYRNSFTHGVAPSEVSNGYTLKQHQLVDVFKTDSNGRVILDNQNRPITEQKRATVLSKRAGDYTSVKVVMKNIEQFAIFSGEKITELVDLILRQ